MTVQSTSHAVRFDNVSKQPKAAWVTASTLLRSVGIVAIALTVANCGSNKQRAGIDPKYGVRPSPKMVADGDAVPNGGGFDKTGKPYVVAGKLYVPREDKNYSAVGLASWYGPSFHGRSTANGEVFNRQSVTVAHPTMPLPSYVRVTNMLNGRSMIARVNDRGPYHNNRLVDVSEQVASSLNFRHLGTARVRVDYVGRAPLQGDDNAMMLATLRTDGSAAQLNGYASPVQVASTRETAPVSEQSVSRVVAPVAEPEIETVAVAPASGAPLSGVSANVPVPPDRPFALASGSRGQAVFTAPMRATIAPVATTPSFAPETVATAVFAPMPATVVPLPPARPQLALNTVSPNAGYLVPPVPPGFSPPLRGSMLR